MSVAIDLKLPSNEILLFGSDGSVSLSDRQEVMGLMTPGFSMNNTDQLQNFDQVTRRIISKPSARVVKRPTVWAGYNHIYGSDRERAETRGYCVRFRQRPEESEVGI